MARGSTGKTHGHMICKMARTGPGRTKACLEATFVQVDGVGAARAAHVYATRQKRNALRKTKVEGV